MASKKEMLGIRIKPQTRTKLNEIADKKDMTVSELVRMVVENFVNMS